MMTTILTVAEVAYLVVLSGWILLEKRSPIATVAWILALAALPVVGLLLFYFLGPRHLFRKRSKHKAARAAVRARIRENAQLPSDSDELRQFMRLVYEVGGDPPTTARDVQLLTSSEQCYDAINQAIGEANHHVHVTLYILEPGEAGDRLRQSLIDAAARGAQVRLLMDAVGSNRATRRWLRPLKSAGVHVAFFNSVGFRRFRAPINFRNHRKIIVCDGKVGFTGGYNVCDDYVGSAQILSSKAEKDKRTPPWRDTHVMVRGDAVRWLQLSFFDDWHYTVGDAPEGPEFLPPPEDLAFASPLPEGAVLAQAVPGGPDQRKEPIRNVYFAALGRARERAWLTMAYFVPDEPMLAALKTASLRGVDVRVLVPRVGDSRVVSAATRSYYDELNECGVKMYEYVPTMHHAKTMLVDDGLSIVGSANFDARSFRLNFEMMLVFYDRRVNDQLSQLFQDDLRQSERVTGREPALLTPVERLAEAAARVLSPIL